MRHTNINPFELNFVTICDLGFLSYKLYKCPLDTNNDPTRSITC